MSALEQEIIEKFHQLQPAAKQRILALIEQEVALEVKAADASTFDYAAWFGAVKTLRQQIQTTRGGNVDVVGMLRDIRDGEDE